jgi:hypothetical protein
MRIDLTTTHENDYFQRSIRWFSKTAHLHLHVIEVDVALGCSGAGTTPQCRYATMRTIDPRHLVETRSGMPIAPLWHVTRRASQDWWNDNCLRLAASLAYYTALSLAPLVLLIVGVIGLVLDRQQVGSQLSAQLEGLIGPAGRDSSPAFSRRRARRGGRSRPSSAWSRCSLAPPPSSANSRRR